MKVKYEIFDSDAYHSACAVIEDLFPTDPWPDIEEFIESGTGEIVEFIKGGFFSGEDRFIILDDETKEFKKVKVSDCEGI